MNTTGTIGTPFLGQIGGTDLQNFSLIGTAKIKLIAFKAADICQLFDYFECHSYLRNHLFLTRSPKGPPFPAKGSQICSHCARMRSSNKARLSWGSRCLYIAHRIIALFSRHLIPARLFGSVGKMVSTFRCSRLVSVVHLTLD